MVTAHHKNSPVKIIKGGQCPPYENLRERNGLGVGTRRNVEIALDIRATIEEELFGTNVEVLTNFRELLVDEINEFINETVKAHNEWKLWDSKINDDEQKALVSAFIFNALNLVLISTKLFIHGYVVPSGNLVRTAMESCAMAILCSNKELPFYQQIREDNFRASAAVKTVEGCADELGVNQSSLTEFKKHWAWYHNYSHATTFSLAAIISSEGGVSNIHFGSVFAPEKKDTYKKELMIRIHIMRNMENMISGIAGNFK